jgi:hypothetical protein
MKPEVAKAVEELRRQYPGSTVSMTEDAAGLVKVIIDPLDLGDRFTPTRTWFGFAIPQQYPYADIYPLFMGADVRRSNGAQFVAPINPGQQFEGRPATMISRKNGAATTTGRQTAVAKLLKVVNYLQQLP